jgi:hypothetical protein
LTLNAWYDQHIETRNELNLGAINNKILTWEALFGYHINQQDLGLDYHFIFFHIFKTAGTTLNRIIGKNYRINNLIQANAPVIDARPEVLLKHTSCMRVIMGHLELNDLPYQLMDRSHLVHTTLLRDPVERVISYYDHIRTRERHLLHSQVKHLTLAEFIHSDLVNDVNNGQALRLLGLLKQQQFERDQRDDDALYADAQSMLLNDFSVVGLTHDFDRYILQNHLLLGWHDICYEQLNQSREKTQVETLSADLLDQIRQKNAVDIRLYEFTKTLVDERCERLGIDDNMLKRYRQNNQRFNQLLAVDYLEKNQ